MAEQQSPAELNAQAANLARDYADDYFRALILIAKQRAYKDNRRVVTVEYVMEAEEEAARRRKRTSWSEIGLLFGGAFFGASVQGFITEIATGRDQLVVVYVIVGLIGVVLAFLSLPR